jgi:hypothetical protein
MQRARIKETLSEKEETSINISPDAMHTKITADIIVRLIDFFRKKAAIIQAPHKIQ